MARPVSFGGGGGNGASGGTTRAARLLAAATVLCCSSLAAALPQSRQCGPCACDSWAAGSATARCRGSVVDDIPAELPKNVSSLMLLGTALKTLKADRLSRLDELAVFYMAYDSSLIRIERGAFDGMLKLTDLVINHCKNLRTIDAGVFTEFGQLRSIDLRYNGLLEVPDFSAFVNFGSTLLVRVNLDDNSISRLASRSWCKGTNGCQPSVEFGPVTIRSNPLEEIEAMAFAGSAITTLDLSNNVRLQTLHSSSFEGISLLSTLWLANTSITSLPSSGLEGLRELHLENTPSLKTLPATVQYQELRRAYVHYPHLCCAFQYPKVQNELEYGKIKKLQEERCSAATLWSGNNVHPTRSATWAGRRTGFVTEQRIRRAAAPRNGSASPKLGGGGAPWGGFNVANLSPSAFTTATRHRLHKSSNGRWVTDSGSQPNPGELAYNPCSSDEWNLHLWREQNFRCTPAPNAFNPCIDVLEADWLRSVMWLAALLTVLGNAAVLLLTLFVKAPMTVAKFLVCNLVVADFFLGTYLISLAVEDARTTGNYFNYALWWQYGGACDVVGFLAVFGAELSVFTLVVITLERWYTISNAMQLTKRIKMRHAVYIMLGGWLLCAAVAAAPILGASSYQITSLCLPFRYESSADKAYVTLLLVANMGAFVMVLACYASMYAQVRGSTCMVNKSDTEMAKRMAYLVAVDFLCWGPVAIVAGLSAGGVDINVPRLSGSSLTHAKVVLALFFPINALANPFLYALLTRQFQNDLVATFYRWGICQKKFMSYAMDTFGHSSSSGGAGRRASNSRSAAGDRLPLSFALSAVGAPLLAKRTEAAGGEHVRCNSEELAELLRRGSGTSDRSCCSCDGRHAGGSSAALLFAHHWRHHEYGLSPSAASTQQNEEIELTCAVSASCCCCCLQQTEPAAEVSCQRWLVDEYPTLSCQGLRMLAAGKPADGVHSSADGVHSSADGVRSSADGVHSSADGVHSSADGVHSSADGVHSSADGVHSSADGVHSSADGVHSSADGVVRSSADGECECKPERLIRIGSPSSSSCINEEIVPAAAASVEAVGTAICATLEADLRRQLADGTNSASGIDTQEAEEGAAPGATQAIRMCDDGTGRLQQKQYQPSDASAVATNVAVDESAEPEPLLGESGVPQPNADAAAFSQRPRDFQSRPSNSCSSYNEDTTVVTFEGSSFLAVS